MSIQPTAQQVCLSVCASAFVGLYVYVFVQALCLARACTQPVSAVSNLTESHTLYTVRPVVLSNDY